MSYAVELTSIAHRQYKKLPDKVQDDFRDSLDKSTSRHVNVSGRPEAVVNESASQPVYKSESRRVNMSASLRVNGKSSCSQVHPWKELFSNSTCGHVDWLTCGLKELSVILEFLSRLFYIGSEME